MLKWFKSLLTRKSGNESGTVGITHSPRILSQDGEMWLDIKGNPALRRRIHAATSGTPFIYDEHKYGGGMPTPEDARLLLEDFETGLAIPHTLIEPGWKERLESIAAGRPVDPCFWQR